MKRIYLDNAATTPIRDEVIEAMLPYLKEHFGNPSAIHAFGRNTKNAIEEARKVIAAAIHASPSEVFFTSSGTEANNMAIQCSVRDLGVQHIISSPTEHHCVLDTVEAVAPQLHWLKIDEKGRIDLADLKELLISLKGEKVLISIMHANNEIGTTCPLKKISELAAEYGALFHCDTVQTFGHFPIDVSKLFIHFISGSAHKLHGPKGTGFLYVNGDVSIQKMMYGGGQERNMRAGTENVAGIVGFAKATSLAIDEMDKNAEYIKELKNYMIAGLKHNFEDIDFNGDIGDSSLYTVLNVSFPPSAKNELLLFNLDINGIAASGGSACTSGVDNGSHVLNAMGANPKRKGIRFSFSHFNTKEEIDFVIEKLKTIL